MANNNGEAVPNTTLKPPGARTTSRNFVQHSCATTTAFVFYPCWNKWPRLLNAMLVSVHFIANAQCPPTGNRSALLAMLINILYNRGVIYDGVRWYRHLCCRVGVVDLAKMTNKPTGIYTIVSLYEAVVTPLFSGRARRFVLA